jgi:uncharacterized membrane protein
MGILLAITALFSWGLGDFLIEKSARKFGDWMALFYITAFGAVILFPFVYHDLAGAFASHWLLLAATSAVMLAAAALDLEALRRGKISVIEPICAFEIPVSAFLAAFLIGEHPTVLQIILIVAIMAGIFLVSVRSFHAMRSARFEKGTWYAIFGTIGLGTSAFFYGIGARETNPLIVNWVANLVMAAASFGAIAFRKKIRTIGANLKGNLRLVANMSFFDNLAWITFSYAMLFIPIAIATGISEGYIAFAGLLGLFFNKERLKRHQWLGFLLVAVAVIALAVITNR